MNTHISIYAYLCVLNSGGIFLCMYNEHGRVCETMGMCVSVHIAARVGVGLLLDCFPLIY